MNPNLSQDTAPSDVMAPPTMKTYEDFLASCSQESESVKKQLYKNYVFATRELERKRKQYQRKREAYLAKTPVDQRPKIGRPKKKTIEDYQKEVEGLQQQLETLQKQLATVPTVSPAPA